ncbi:MAG TPA: hypothetical protein DEB31_01920, partial [Clostridiales bacterium]|nr:hypothetical protein [Clostridiales bacterium]
AHAVRGTDGAAWARAFYTDIKKTPNTPIERYTIFNKGEDKSREEYSAARAKNDAFGPLIDNLEKHVTVVGAATEYCVLETVKELLGEGFFVTVPESCLAFTEESGHARGLREMEACGAVVIKDARQKQAREEQGE